MAVYCTNKLQLDRGKVNVRGGAIALGHPLGATGARQIVTGLAEMRKRKKQVLVTAMCIGETNILLFANFQGVGRVWLQSL